MPISVFARVRPLIPSEVGSDHLPGLQLQSSDPNETSTVVLSSMTPIDGYTGVMGQEANNRAVFERCFSDRVSTVMRGGTASLFCYGYTGAGKTHTVIGYGQEQGVFFLAAERLLQELNSKSDLEKTFLRATACEIYNDSIFDLLGTEKLACALAIDEMGQLQILGPPLKTQLDVSEGGSETKNVGAEKHATIVTKKSGLRAASVFQPEDLEKMSKTCVQQRACGSSTEHHESSRSHAILRLEVVNATVVEAQEALTQANAVLPARKNALDNISSSLYHELFEYLQCLRVGQPPDYSKGLHEVSQMVDQVWQPESDPAWIVDREIQHQDSQSTFCLRGFTYEPKTIKEWCDHFDVPLLNKGYLLVKKTFDKPGMWESKYEALKMQKNTLKQLVEMAQKDAEDAAANLSKVMRQGPPSLGGSLLLVDLAGADYDHRTGTQQKESAAINKSLLALKECFRSLAKASPQKPKFRDSKLTRVLEDSLAPTASSGRLNKESVSVMIVNVSPAARFEAMTINGLRYGQMFGGGRSASGRGGSEKSNGPGGSARPVGKAAACTGKPASATRGMKKEHCDSKVREELLSIYREYSDKNEAEVQSILSKFAGKEEELLVKVQNKYLNVAAA